MGASITLAIPVVANTTGYELAMNRIKTTTSYALSSITVMQRRIDAQFQLAGNTLAENIATRLQTIEDWRAKVVPNDPFHSISASTWLPGKLSDLDKLKAKYIDIINWQEKVFATDPFHQPAEATWLPGKTAGVDVARIARRLQMEGELGQAVLRATRSANELALIEHNRYFAALRRQFAYSQQALTQITKLEVAKRAAIMNQFSMITNFGPSSISIGRGLNSGLASGVADAPRTIFSIIKGGLGKLGWIGLGIYAGSVLVEGIGKGMEAHRKGQNGFLAGLEAMPLISIMASAVRKVKDEWTGAASAIEKYKARVEISEKAQSIGFPLLNQRRLLMTPAGERFKTEATQEYAQSIRDIAKLMPEIEKVYGKSTAYKWAREMHSAAVEIRNFKLAEPFNDLTTAIEQQIFTFGVSARAADIYKATIMGASYAQLQLINNLHDELDALEANRKAMEDYKSILDEINDTYKQAANNLKGLTPEQQKWADIQTRINAMPFSAEKFKLQGQADTGKLFADVDAYFEKQKKQSQETKDVLMRLWEPVMTPAEKYYKTILDTQEALKNLRVPQQVKDELLRRVQGKAWEDYVASGPKLQGEVREVRGGFNNVNAAFGNANPTVSLLQRIAENTNRMANKEGIN